jgi:predicted dehydrogenase
MPARDHETTPTTALALAGAGHIASVHALAAAEADLPVRWVASRNRGRARALAAEVGAEACTYDDLPAGAGLVVVATPPPWHAGPALRALEAGATALVEKPVTATLVDADSLVEAERTGGHVHYGENLLLAPVFAAALERISGAGPLRHIEARLLMPRPDWGEFLHGNWGGGALFDSGAHPLALALAAAGDDRPTSVSARLDRQPGESVDDAGELELTFASGLRAVVIASWRHEARTRDLQAASHATVIRAELLPSRSLEVDGAPVSLPPAPVEPTAFRLHQFGFVAQLRAACADPDAAPPVGAVGGVPRPDAAFGRRVLEVLCGAYASAGAGGAAVRLPFTGDRRRTPLELWRSG